MDPAHPRDLFLNQSQAQALTRPNGRHYPSIPEPAPSHLSSGPEPASGHPHHPPWEGSEEATGARAPADRAAIPWALEPPAMMPTPPSQVRQNYRLECEAALNCHAALEFHASFQCLALAFYLDRDDVGLKHFYRFFLLRSHEHSKTAESLMFLQNQRGGRVSFFDIRKPETQQWESALRAMQDTLHLEKCVNQSLLDLHKLATDSSTPICAISWRLATWTSRSSSSRSWEIMSAT